MRKLITGKPNILYVFGGEKAQGAEIVIERLMMHNLDNVNTHLILSPGKFADELIAQDKPYAITKIDHLKKLNRSSTGKFTYLRTALKNYMIVPWKIYKYIKRHNISILHVNTILPASYLLPLVWYAKIFRRSLTCCWSDHDLKYFNKLDMLLSKLCASSFQYTFVVSEAVKRKNPPSKKVIVLYNGLDTNEFKPDERQRIAFRKNYGIGSHELVIGLAAAINPDKGQLQLIHVFNQLTACYPEARLLVAGSYASHFPEYGKLVAEEMEKNGQIIYAGFLEAMTTFYNGCDIVVNNSNNYRSESLGTTIYEAMACEKIVLAADTGGTPEIIDDLIDGYLFEPENENDLYKKLTFLIGEQKNQDDVRRAARKKVERKFNIKVMVSMYNEILNIREQQSQTTS